MSQMVKGFFGRDRDGHRDREGHRDRDVHRDRGDKFGHRHQHRQQSEESDGQFRDLDEQSLEPMELTSDKRSHQVGDNLLQLC